jgi:5'-nucleotidase
MRVLVTNDDGIDSPGLRALAEVVRDRGHDVLVAAPSSDRSGTSSSVTGVTRVTSISDVVWEPRPWDGWPPDTVRSVDATPALITLIAVHEQFGPRPDLVVSGINLGANTGRAILHSGTVGAAFTAYQNGCPALAMSLDVVDDRTDPVHWDTAGVVAGRILDWMGEDDRPVVINANVPNLAVEELAGTRQGTLDLLGTFQAVMTEESGRTVRVTVAEEDDPGAETDSALLQRGFVSVTPLRPVVEDPAVDLKPLLD